MRPDARPMAARKIAPGQKHRVVITPQVVILCLILMVFARENNKAVLKCARQEYGRLDTSMRELGRKYEEGGEKAVGIVDNVLRYLAIALANKANNCFPDSLILTGGLLFLGKTFQRKLEESVRSLLFESANYAMKMIFQEGGGNEAAGATLMVVDKLLSSPDAFNKACPRLDG